MLVNMVLAASLLVGASSTVINIGALVDKESSALERAFRFAIHEANQLSPGINLTLHPNVQKVDSEDSFQTSRRLCHLLKTGVGAVIGPDWGTAAAHVSSICDTKAVPHLATDWRFRRPGERWISSLNLYPAASALSKAYTDVVRTLRWRKFHVLYEDNDSLVRLQEVLKMPDVNNKLSVAVRQLPKDGEYRRLLKQIQNSGGTHLLVDCAVSTVHPLLKQAQQIGMVTRHYHFFFTNLDLHTVDLHDFQFAGTNITAVRLVQTNSLHVVQTVQNWRRWQDRLTEGARNASAPPSVGRLSTGEALMYDAVLLYARAVQILHDRRYISISPLSCDSDEAWKLGDTLYNYMNTDQAEGLTGMVQFTDGQRSDFHLDVLTLLDRGLTPLGQWSREGVSLVGADHAPHLVPSIKDQTLIVTTLLKKPYTMEKESSKKLEGNDRYEGICIDIIDDLSKVLRFNYTIQLNSDNAPGTLDEATGRWSGMIGDLLEGRADLAIADLTITSEREQVVDFTMQFMTLGISILYRKPTKQPPQLFSFLSPLSLRVWLYMGTATVGVSLILFVLARFTPYEWESPHPCAPDQDTLENVFNFHNCVWFCIGSLMQQGCDFLPKAVSTRMVAGIWWFFTLIMISSYTANLAAFLTVERMESPIESAEDLAAQSKIKYGMYAGGSTANFFRTSKIPPYNKMWQVMQNAQPSVFFGEDAGIEQVKSGGDVNSDGFAYFMESSTIEYTVERNCDLTQIGGLLDNKGYGIALPPDSPWIRELNQQMLQMQEQGRLSELKTLWWERRDNDQNCGDDNGGQVANALDLENVGGVFVCLMGGMVVASLLAVVEFVWHVRKQRSDHKTSLLYEMAQELRFILSCRGNTKPARPGSRRGPDMEDSGLMAPQPRPQAKHPPPLSTYASFEGPTLS